MLLSLNKEKKYLSEPINQDKERDFSKIYEECADMEVDVAFFDSNINGRKALSYIQQTKKGE